MTLTFKFFYYTTSKNYKYDAHNITVFLDIMETKHGLKISEEAANLAIARVH